MKKIIVLLLIATFTVSCTKEIYNEHTTVVEGATFEKISLAKVQPIVTESNSNIVCELTFYGQEIRLDRIEVVLEQLRGDDITEYVTDVQLVKVGSQPNDIYPNHLYIDDEEYDVQFLPHASDHKITYGDTYQLVIETTDVFPETDNFEIDIEVTLSDMFGGRYHFRRDEIEGNINTLIFEKQ